MLRQWLRDLERLDQVNSTSWARVVFDRDLTREEYHLFAMCRLWIGFVIAHLMRWGG
jgi:hypothetical protein